MLLSSLEFFEGPTIESADGDETDWVECAEYSATRLT
jgi:hypothetical protein